jgi:hypothetical protein
MPKDIPTKHPIRTQTFNPKKVRKDEVIGGGYFVFRRGDGTKRIRPPLWPYEHETFASAQGEAARLAVAQHGAAFEVYRCVGVYQVMP